MSKDPLIPPETLVPIQSELLRRIDQLDPPLAVDVREGEAGEALARSLLFEHWPDLLGGGEGLDRERLLYNRYYWFVRFVALWQAAHGYDAGLEQQVFQMVERADTQLDWDLLKQLDARARHGVAVHPLRSP